MGRSPTVPQPTTLCMDLLGASAQDLVSSVHRIFHPLRQLLHRPLRGQRENFTTCDLLRAFLLYFVSCSTSKALKLLLQSKTLLCAAVLFLLPQTHPKQEGSLPSRKEGAWERRIQVKRRGGQGKGFSWFCPTSRGTGEQLGSQHRQPVPRTWRFPYPAPTAAWALPLESVNKGKGKEREGEG